MGDNTAAEPVQPQEEQAGPGPSSTAADSVLDDELLKAFFSEVKEVDRDNEVNRILWAFKLNPFEQLNLKFDATVEEIRKQYRKLSLLVHPDKCKHPQASAAFDVLGAAQKLLLDDDLREALLKVLNVAKEDVRAERKKETKHDNAVKLASVLHEKGREGVEAEYEQTEEFHERWRAKARDLLAKSEFRKRKMAKRVKDETKRIEQEEGEKREQIKKMKEHHEKWENTREQRVTTWHDFMKGQGGKVKTTGMVKPPKQKTNDEDKLYVQRAVTSEEFRQQAPKAGPKKDW